MLGRRNRCPALEGRRYCTWLLLGTIGASLLGCAGTTPLPLFRSDIARPGPGEIVIVDAAILVFDASGSIDRREVFPKEKAFFQSFVAGMPPGTYRVALRVLGASKKDQLDLEPFDRFELTHRARKLSWTGRETPLTRVLERYIENPPQAETIAFVILTDGVPTRYGYPIGPEETLATARALLEQTQAQVCFHLIQIEADPRGKKLIDPMGKMTACSTRNTLSELNAREPLFAYQQAIFNGPQPPPPKKRARRMIDLDRDGVDDQIDLCPGTPMGAAVDPRGCWVIADTVFQTNRATIRPDQRPRLDQVVSVLEQNPTVRVRLDGHTDNTGTTQYNLNLARARAEAVQRYLEARGIDGTRLSIRSFGPTRPMADNDTTKGRSLNRRVELSVVDL